MAKTILALIAFGLYLSAAFGLLLRLAGREKTPPTPTVPILATGAALAHAALIYLSTLSSQGFYLGFFSAGSLIGLLMAVLLLAASLREPVSNLGLLIYPISGITALLSVMLTQPESGTQHLPHGLGSHILSSILAYSVLAIAALQALLLAFQEYKLRHRHPGGIIRLLPPMETMEILLFQMLRLGFILLSVSLITGFVFLENMFAQHLVHKTILSLIAWAVFAILLLGHWRFGWRGQKAIRWTLGGFTTLMLAYFGSKLVLELILHRY